MPSSAISKVVFNKLSTRCIFVPYLTPIASYPTFCHPLMSFVQSQIVVKMKEIKFNPNGADLQARILYKGLIVAGYSLRLYERDSNRIVMRRNGNNVNPELNIHDLPSPAKDNVGRVFRLLTDLRGLDPVESPQYKIILEIYQGGVRLGEETEEGLITGGVQESRINLKLIANT